MKKIEALQILGLTGDVTKKDIKLAYKRKAKEFHPDRNPVGANIMKMINVAYELVKNEERVFIEEDVEISAYPEKMSKALNAIIDLNLDIEVCGCWVWVSGDTKTHKNALKSAGFLWAPKKKMWYFRLGKAKRWYKHGEWTIDEIRSKHNTNKVYKAKIPKLAHAH